MLLKQRPPRCGRLWCFLGWLTNFDDVPGTRRVYGDVEAFGRVSCEAPLPGSSLVESGNGAAAGSTPFYGVGQVSASMVTVPVPEEASRPMAPTLLTDGTVQVMVVHCPWAKATEPAMVAV